MELAALIKRRYDHGDTMVIMKIAISLPDDLFAQAEQFAHAVGKPRSQVYADALVEYLARHSESSLTEQFDAVYRFQASDLPSGAMAAQRRVLGDEAW
jgi:hypothetical protein